MRPFIAVMIIPTGIGAAIGGHAGDATAAARLLAGACDTLIVHPNVVNAAGLNEMPPNALYVEGSMLDRFLRGEIYLEPVRANHILVVCNILNPMTLNAAGAARSLLGARVDVLVLDRSLRMVSRIQDGIAGGTVEGVDEMCNQVASLKFDALAVHTEIEVDPDEARRYLKTGDGVNPWGGVEAMVSRRASAVLGRPVAHAPIENDPCFNEVVPQALAPELISGSMLFSVLKGLHKAPRIGTEAGHHTLAVDDVDALVSPVCWGAPHIACEKAGIPILIVASNTTNVPMGGGETFSPVPSYLAAVGALVALRQGLSLEACE
ncbi:MAG: DUF3326 domain-containing protein [Planctomycetes bacterium]|nr:DUF3326 domain-containing protein [Planctomycetota bacterium]